MWVQILLASAVNTLLNVLSLTIKDMGVRAQVDLTFRTVYDAIGLHYGWGVSAPREVVVIGPEKGSDEA